MQIDLTWNLFATPIFMFVLYLVLKYHLGSRFTDIEATLKNNNEAAIKQLDKNNTDAIERFKENKTTLMKIDGCVTSLKVEMEKRITRPECDSNHKDVWERIHELEGDMKYGRRADDVRT